MKFLHSSSVFLTPWNTPIWIYLSAVLHFDLHLPTSPELSKNPLPSSSLLRCPLHWRCFPHWHHPGFSVHVVTTFLHYVATVMRASLQRWASFFGYFFSLILCLSFMVMSFILSKDIFECFAVYMGSYLGSKLSEFLKSLFSSSRFGWV